MLWIPPELNVLIVPSDLDRYFEFSDFLSMSFDTNFIIWDVSVPLDFFLTSNSLHISKSGILCATNEHLSFAHNLNLYTIYCPELKYVILGTPDLNRLPDAKLSFDNEGKESKMYFTLNNIMGRTAYSGSLFRNKDGNSPILLLGKYFTSSDLRYPYDLYTRMILGVKSGTEQIFNLFFDAIGKQLASIIKSYQIDYITIVPPKPDKLQNGKNSMGDFLLGLESYFRTGNGRKFRISENVQFSSDILYCNRSYPPQKEAGSYAQRARNVKDVFSLHAGISIVGKRFLVLDDVYTSGSTLTECKKILMDNGATIVVQAPLGITQKASTMPFFGVNEELGSCIMRFNKRNGTPLYYGTDGKIYKYEDVLIAFKEHVDNFVR